MMASAGSNGSGGLAEEQASSDLVASLQARTSLGLPRSVKPTVGKHGAVACGSPHGVRIALDLLKAGGCAADAAVGMAFALIVADPVNCSPAGRGHVLYRQDDEEPHAINGTTRAPEHVRAGAAPIPLPGILGALLQLHGKSGKLPLGQILQPVIELAETGFEVPDELAQIWAVRAGDLKDEDARSWYLPKGKIPVAGDVFRHAGLALFFRELAASGKDPFADIEFMSGMCARNAAKGLSWTEKDVWHVFPRDGEVVRLAEEDWELVSIGRQGWGHTLLQITALNQWAAKAGFTGEALELAQLMAIAQAFDDRPQHLRSLKPKSSPIPFEDLLDRALFAEAEAWRNVRSALSGDLDQHDLVGIAPEMERADLGVAAEERDTTHMSVIDANGLQVSITQSIGPHFGARMADPKYGILFGHSYQMEFDPLPLAEDVTEQCPSLLRKGDAVYALGGAGSERIPGAVANVVRHLIAGDNLASAMCRPRANWVGPLVRLHIDAPRQLLEKLQKAGINTEITDRGPVDHLGIVHAVGRRGASFEASADPAYAGAAGVC